MCICFIGHSISEASNDGRSLSDHFHNETPHGSVCCIWQLLNSTAEDGGCFVDRFSNSISQICICFVGHSISEASNNGRCHSDHFHNGAPHGSVCCIWQLLNGTAEEGSCIFDSPKHQHSRASTSFVGCSISKASKNFHCLSRHLHNGALRISAFRIRQLLNGVAEDGRYIVDHSANAKPLILVCHRRGQCSGTLDKVPLTLFELLNKRLDAIIAAHGAAWTGVLAMAPNAHCLFALSLLAGP